MWKHPSVEEGMQEGLSPTVRWPMQNTGGAGKGGRHPASGTRRPVDSLHQEWRRRAPRQRPESGTRGTDHPNDVLSAEGE